MMVRFGTHADGPVSLRFYAGATYNPHVTNISLKSCMDFRRVARRMNSINANGCHIH